MKNSEANGGLGSWVDWILAVGVESNSKKAAGGLALVLLALLVLVPARADGQHTDLLKKAPPNITMDQFCGDWIGQNVDNLSIGELGEGVEFCGLLPPSQNLKLASISDANQRVVDEACGKSENYFAPIALNPVTLHKKEGKETHCPVFTTYEDAQAYCRLHPANIVGSFTGEKWGDGQPKVDGLWCPKHFLQKIDSQTSEWKTYSALVHLQNLIQERKDAAKQAEEQRQEAEKRKALGNFDTSNSETCESVAKAMIGYSEQDYDLSNWSDKSLLKMQKDLQSCHENLRGPDADGYFSMGEFHPSKNQEAQTRVMGALQERHLPQEYTEYRLVVRKSTYVTIGATDPNGYRHEHSGPIQRVVVESKNGELLDLLCFGIVKSESRAAAQLTEMHMDACPKLEIGNTYSMRRYAQGSHVVLSYPLPKQAGDVNWQILESCNKQGQCTTISTLADRR